MKRPRSDQPTAVPIPPLTSIAFRLDERNAQALAERAARLQTSPHHVARDMVISLLCEPDFRAATHESLLVLHDSLNTLRGDLATVAKALLTTAGNIEETRAEAWVIKTFN